MIYIRKTAILPLLMAFGILIFLSSFSMGENASAGSSRYELTYEEMNLQYSKGGEPAQRIVYVSQELYQYLQYVSYDVISSDGNEIMYERLRANNGAVVNSDVTVEKENVIVRKEDLTKGTTGKKAFYFTVENDHCCAFIFTVHYDKGEEEDEVYYDSAILYLKTVDDKAPIVEVKEYNRFTYSVTCKFTEDNTTCAASGVKSYIVYQLDTTTKVKKTYFSSEKIYNNTASFTLSSGKYYYYITATDAVGNVSEEKLIATFDVDELISSANNAFNTIASAPNDWAESFKTKLNNAYSEYEIAQKGINGEVSDEELQEKATALSGVLDEYRGYVADKLNGRLNAESRFVNTEYLPDVSILNLEKACAFIKYGENGTLTVSIGKFSGTKGHEEEAKRAGVKDADDVYAFSVQTFTTERSLYQGSFDVPLKLSCSVGKYEEVGAVQVTEGENGYVYTPCNVTEYTSGKIVLNVQKTDGTVYLFVKNKEKNLKLLYLLFLIIPVGAAIALPIVLKKKGKRSKQA